MGQRHNSFPEERFTAAHAFLYIGRQMKSFQVEWQFTIAASDWVILYLEKSGGMNNWRLNLRGTWSFTFSDTYIAFTSPWQDPTIGVLLWLYIKQKFNSDFQFELPEKWLLILWFLPLVMWIVDGSVSQVPLIKFVLLARVSRDEPAPNRMIKTYQNILFYYYEMNYWVVEMCFLLLVVLLLLSFQYWSRWQPIEVVLMCGDHFISDVPYLTAQRAAMAFTCQSRD